MYVTGKIKQILVAYCYENILILCYLRRTEKIIRITFKGCEIANRYFRLFQLSFFFHRRAVLYGYLCLFFPEVPQYLFVTVLGSHPRILQIYCCGCIPFFGVEKIENIWAFEKVAVAFKNKSKKSNNKTEFQWIFVECSLHSKQPKFQKKCLPQILICTLSGLIKKNKDPPL